MPEAITVLDLLTWLHDARRAVAGRATFGQLIDLRAPSQLHLDGECERIMREMMTALKEQGLTRSAVVVSSHRCG